MEKPACTLISIEEEHIEKARVLLTDASLPFSIMGRFTPVPPARSGVTDVEYVPIYQQLENVGFVVKRAGRRNRLSLRVHQKGVVKIDGKCLVPNRMYDARVYIARRTLRGVSHYNISPVVVSAGAVDKWMLLYDVENNQLFLITQDELSIATWRLIRGKKVPAISRQKHGALHLTMSRRRTSYLFSNRVQGRCIEEASNAD